mgnify:CR=1 FL=1
MFKRLSAAIVLLGVSAASTVPAGVSTAHAAACTVEVGLTPGTTHSSVNCLEQRLLELGISGIVGPDSMYDSVSVNAVKAFQSSRGLYSDGVLTSVTSRELGLRGPLPPPAAPRVTVLGDSTAAAMRWYDEANNTTVRYDVIGSDYDLLWSLESCRRLVAESCVGRSDPGTNTQWRPVSVLPLMQTTLRGELGDALVIMAGYDDTSITDAIDPIMAEAEAQGVSRVFWLTYRTSTSYSYGAYYEAHNAALAAAATRYPDLVVLDWNGYTLSQPERTQTAWFEADEIHITAAGATALAEWLERAIVAWSPVPATPLRSPGVRNVTPRVFRS